MNVVQESAAAAEKIQLRRLHTATVAPDQIDQLGHMNVRYYGVRSTAASRALAEDLDLTRGTPDRNAVRLTFTDLFTRHYREQLEGARLEVLGGVLDAWPTGVRMYQELRNADSGELSATFVHVMQMQDRATRTPLNFAPEVLETCRAALVDWPEHGRPRSINLESAPASLSLAEARARGLEARLPRTIDASECGSEGFFKSSQYLNLSWGGTRPDGVDDEDDDWIRTYADGRRYGWATMESRGTLFRLPRAGARIQSFGANVELGRKTRHEKFWVFDLDREDLLCTAQIVNVAFDIGARKAIEIPEEHRKELEARSHPDLA